MSYNANQNTGGQTAMQQAQKQDCSGIKRES